MTTSLYQHFRKVNTELQKQTKQMMTLTCDVHDSFVTSIKDIFVASAKLQKDQYRLYQYIPTSRFLNSSPLHPQLAVQRTQSPKPSFLLQLHRDS